MLGSAWRREILESYSAILISLLPQKIPLFELSVLTPGGFSHSLPVPSASHIVFYLNELPLETFQLVWNLHPAPFEFIWLWGCNLFSQPCESHFYSLRNEVWRWLFMIVRFPWDTPYPSSTFNFLWPYVNNVCRAGASCCELMCSAMVWTLVKPLSFRNVYEQLSAVHVLTPSHNALRTNTLTVLPSTDVSKSWVDECRLVNWQSSHM